ncbi:MAG: hypothetical protein IPI05_13785 [Flavobacteriales bacterium]|nr:hypothetical protein [Flavobacteriales bacterium]
MRGIVFRITREIRKFILHHYIRILFGAIHLGNPNVIHETAALALPIFRIYGSNAIHLLGILHKAEY